jgi:hypothetical protein
MKIDYTTYKRPSNFLKLSKGNNTIRLISDGDLSPRHKAKTKDGFKELGICTGVGCEICRKFPDNLPKDTYRWVALNRNDGLVGVLEASSGWGADLTELIQSAEGESNSYDIVINKSGSGRDTRYVATVAPQSPAFTDAEKAMMQMRKPILVRKYLNG